jgi:hypothetical protein
VEIFTQKFESEEQAHKVFENQKNPLSSSQGKISEDVTNFATEAFLKYEGVSNETVTVYLSKGNYYVSIKAKKTDALRFAGHLSSTLAALN